MGTNQSNSAVAEAQGETGPGRMFDMDITAAPKVQTHVYTLRKEQGGWLAQVVLTSDGMFAAVSDYGDFAFAWRAFGAERGRDFRDFLLGLDLDYFGSKMALGYAYVVSTNKVREKAFRFAAMVLPALKAAMRAEGRG